MNLIPKWLRRLFRKELPIEVTPSLVKSILDADHKAREVLLASLKPQLTDYQKAARLEYKFFRDMAQPKMDTALKILALQNSPYYAPSGQMVQLSALHGGYMSSYGQHHNLNRFTD